VLQVARSAPFLFGIPASEMLHSAVFLRRK
jgi:hypothetical protein